MQKTILSRKPNSSKNESFKLVIRHLPPFLTEYQFEQSLKTGNAQPSNWLLVEGSKK